MDGIFQKALGCKILPKISHRQIIFGQLLLPIRIVLHWIAIYGFVLAAMHGEVGLAIAIKIQLAQQDAPLNGIFEYGGKDLTAVPENGVRQPNIYGDYFAQ
jgi:hypothetical protein